MADNPFYSQARVGCLGARAKYYASEDRTVGEGKRASAFDWLYKKMAWATASAEAGGSLGLIKGGGIGDTEATGNNIPGLYTTSPRTGARSYKNGSSGLQGDAQRFVPKPHLTSVKVSCVGDLGSIRKVEINFTVYTRGQLNGQSGFFALGKGVNVAYGWNMAGGAGGPSGYFKGKIYNFNYSLNKDGGYDCTCYAMGEGLNALTPNITAPTTGGGTAADPSGVVVNATGILSQIKVDKLNAKSLAKNTFDATTKIGAVEFSDDWATAKDSTEDPPPAAPAGAPKKATLHYYVSLERIVELINKMLISNSKKYNNLTLVCKGDVTIGLKPKDAKAFVSADPTKVLFPGYGNYGKNNFSFDSYDGEFTGGDLSKVMINTDHVSTIFADMTKQFNETKKPGDFSIANFLGRIFSLVNQCSGGLYKLTCAQDADDQTKMLILDADAVPNGVTPTSLNAVSQNGICRSVSLVSKVPSDMATTAFVEAQSSLTSHQPKAFGSVGNNTDAAAANTQPTAEAIKALDEGGCTPANVAALQSALEAERAGVTNEKTKNGYSSSTLIPLEFTATLDGVEGFKFGNVVTTNVMPSKYYDSAGSKVVFCVTTIEHDISGNDWVTTINTVCRLRMQ